MDVRKFISENILILDGAMGTMLQRNGLKPGQLPEELNIINPEAVKNVHNGYFAAGSNMVFTNTFGANRKKLAKSGLNVSQVVCNAVEIAREAAETYGGFVALDIGPLGELMEPAGTLRFQDAYRLFKEQVTAGAAAGADAVAIETMTDLLEIKCALLAVKENCGLPVFCTMSFEAGGHTFMGTALSSMAVTLDGLGADAIGLNCSLGPAEMPEMAEELMRWTNLPLIVKPNAGIPSLVDGSTVFNVDGAEFAEKMDRLLDMGVGIVGGCCGTTPEHIHRLAAKAAGRKPIGREAVLPSCVCSYAETVPIDRVRIIGERINPTGKSKMKEALLSNDMDYLALMAAEQTDAGADILDINVGLPQIDEAEAMINAVKTIQSAVSSPLQLDSTKPAVLEAALRIYNGKPIVNSVNGKETVLAEILPMVKKYGGAVVGLTLDENGIPKTAEERFKIAEKILSFAILHGIRKQDVFIDCLTLTAGAEQESAYQVLEAMRLVKSRLGVKTVLGVSNISFGLPGRERLNQVFLSLALANGLDMPILNPMDYEMVSAVYCFHQLKNIDKGSVEYLKRFQESGNDKSAPVQPNAPEIGFCIEKGLKNEIRASVENALTGGNALSIVNDFLIPALDRVGKEYEQGKIYLPQLLRSAEAATAAMDIIKNSLPRGVERAGERIILATVKGDVHDIGKNIVKAVLKNYGYNIIDLGRDVEIDTIVETAVKYSVKLVGLSALMTTTVDSMEKTIAALKATGEPIAVVVGGAVLTKELSDKIGADFYARDAMAAVAVAKAVFSNCEKSCGVSK